MIALSAHTSLWTVGLLALLTVARGPVMAQSVDRAGKVHVGNGVWITPAQAKAKGLIYYRDRWLSKKLRPKLARWEKLDAGTSNWATAYKSNSKHYRIKTNAPRYVVELEIKPFLDELYRTYLTVFKRDFGLKGKAANKNFIHIYWGYKCWRLNEQADRGNPGYFESGGVLKVLYDPTEPGDFYGTVFHEGAHQFFYAALPGAESPIWLDEALATYFEGCVYSRSTQKIKASHLPPNRVAWAKQQLKEAKAAGGSVSPQRMFMHITEPREFQAQHYSLAWSFVYYLIHRDGGKHRKAFYKFLRAMNGSGAKAVADVFKETTKMDLTEVGKGWADFVLKMPSPPQPVRQVLQPRDAPKEVDVRDGDLLVSVNGHLVDGYLEFDQFWTERKQGRPAVLKLLRRFNERGPMDFEQKVVTAVVPAGSKMWFQVVEALPFTRNLVD